jgi:hypothetical protein
VEESNKPEDEDNQGHDDEEREEDLEDEAAVVFTMRSLKRISEGRKRQLKNNILIKNKVKKESEK